MSAHTATPNVPSLAAGLVDELYVHVAPLLLGAGTRLFEGLEAADVRLELVEAVDAPDVTHLHYRVRR